MNHPAYRTPTPTKLVSDLAHGHEGSIVLLDEGIVFGSKPIDALPLQSQTTNFSAYGTFAAAKLTGYLMRGHERGVFPRDESAFFRTKATKVPCSSAAPAHAGAPPDNSVTREIGIEPLVKGAGDVGASQPEIVKLFERVRNFLRPYQHSVARSLTLVFSATGGPLQLSGALLRTRFVALRVYKMRPM